MGAERLSADVVVAGAGPAGIAAGVHAAEAGARVIVLDESPRPGGSIWRSTRAAPRGAAPWLSRLAGSGAAVVSGATVVDGPKPHRLLVERAGQGAVVDYERLVLATGARELFLPFPGWTLPGVVGAGGAQALLKAGASFAGARVVVAGSGPLLPAVAAALRGAGARVVGIAEQAPLARLAGFAASLGPGRVGEAIGYGARLLGVPYLAGTWVREASGAGAVERVVVTDGRREREWRCDTLACGFGLVASLELPRLLGCDTAAGLVEVDGLQRTSVPDVYAAGELTAIGGSAHAVATGAIAGLAAAGRPVPSALLGARERERAFAFRLARAFRLRHEVLHLARPDTILCRCEDVTLDSVEAALPLAPGGAAASSSAKLHTRAGMGACQGRVCGAALGSLRGASAFTIRPPLVPAPLAVLAGDDLGASAPSTARPPAREERP